MDDFKVEITLLETHKEKPKPEDILERFRENFYKRLEGAKQEKAPDEAMISAEKFAEPIPYGETTERVGTKEIDVRDQSVQAGESAKAQEDWTFTAEEEAVQSMDELDRGPVSTRVEGDIAEPAFKQSISEETPELFASDEEKGAAEKTEDRAPYQTKRAEEFGYQFKPEAVVEGEEEEVGTFRVDDLISAGEESVKKAGQEELESLDSADIFEQSIGQSLRSRPEVSEKPALEETDGSFSIQVMPDYMDEASAAVNTKDRALRARITADLTEDAPSDGSDKLEEEDLEKYRTEVSVERKTVTAKKEPSADNKGKKGIFSFFKKKK